MKLINYNGQLIPSEKAVFGFHNRAFRYGDGLFETLRVINGKIPFIEAHYSRLVSGLRQLQINIPASFSLDFFQKEIQLVAKKKQLGRVRFTAYRSGNGMYLPSQNDLEYLIEVQTLVSDKYNWNPNGLNCGIYREILLSHNLLSQLKSINALPYILAAKFKEQQAWNDVFLLNQQGRIAEAGSSNVVLWDGNSLYTPSLKEACIAGVIRSTLLEKAPFCDVPIQETELSIDDLKNATAIFLTNSIQGINWVRNFEEKSFEEAAAEEVGSKLISLLNRLAKG